MLNHYKDGGKRLLKKQKHSTLSYEIILSNGHSPQIRQNGELLVQMCRGVSHFSQKSLLANVGESGESGQSRLANVGKCIESNQNRLANVGE
jgi:hypothetical protein